MIFFKSLLWAASEGFFDISTFIFCLYKYKHVTSLWVFLLHLYFVFVVVVWFNPSSSFDPQSCSSYPAERGREMEGQKRESSWTVIKKSLVSEAQQSKALILRSPPQAGV